MRDLISKARRVDSGVRRDTDARACRERISLSHRHHRNICSSFGYAKSKWINQCTSYLTVRRERERAHFCCVIFIAVRSLSTRIIGLKLNRKYKTKFIGAFTINNIYFKTSSIHNFMAKVNLAFVKCSRLYMSLSFCTNPVRPSVSLFRNSFGVWKLCQYVGTYHQKHGEELSWLVGEF